MIVEKIKKLHAHILRNILKLISGDSHSLVIIEYELLDDIREWDKDNASVWNSIIRLCTNQDQASIRYSLDSVHIWQKIERGINEREQLGFFSEEFISWLETILNSPKGQLISKDKSVVAGAQIEQAIVPLEDAFVPTLPASDIKSFESLNQGNNNIGATVILPINSDLVLRLKQAVAELDEAYEYQKMAQFDCSALDKLNGDILNSLASYLTPQLLRVLRPCIESQHKISDVLALARTSLNLIFVLEHLDFCKHITNMAQLSQMMQQSVIRTGIVDFKSYIIDLFLKISNAIASKRALAIKDKKFFSKLEPALGLLSLDYTNAIQATGRIVLDESMVDSERSDLLHTAVAALSGDQPSLLEWYQRLNLDLAAEHFRQAEARAIEAAYLVEQNHVAVEMDTTPEVPEVEVALEDHFDSAEIESVDVDPSESEITFTEPLNLEHVELSPADVVPVDSTFLAQDNEISSPLEDNAIHVITASEEVYHAQMNPYYVVGREEVILSSAPDFEEDLMAELVETFTEEANEKIEEIDGYLIDLFNDLNNQNIMLDLRRAFHTIKGSGRMSGLMLVGEIGWQVERVLNGCREGTYPLTEAILYHVKNGRDAIDFSLKGVDVTEELYRLVYQANYLINHQGVVIAQSPTIIPDDLSIHPTEAINVLATNAVVDVQAIENDQADFGAATNVASFAQSDALLPVIEQDHFLNDTNDAMFAESMSVDHELSAAAVNELEFDPKIDSELALGTAASVQIEETNITQTQQEDNTNPVHAQANIFPARMPTMSEPYDLDPKLILDLVDTFTTEIEQEIKGINTALHMLSEGPISDEIVTTLRRYFHTIKGNSRMLGKMTLGEIAWNAERVLNKLLDDGLPMTSHVVAFLTKSVHVAATLFLNEGGSDYHNELACLTYDADYLILHKGELSSDCFSLYQGDLASFDSISYTILPTQEIADISTLQDAFVMDDDIAQDLARIMSTNASIDVPTDIAAASDDNEVLVDPIEDDLYKSLQNYLADVPPAPVSDSGVMNAKDIFSFTDIEAEDGFNQPQLKSDDVKQVLALKDISPEVGSDSIDLKDLSSEFDSLFKSASKHTLAGGDSAMQATERPLLIDLTAPDLAAIVEKFEKCKNGSQKGMREFSKSIDQLHDYYVATNAPKIDVKLAQAFYRHLSSFRAHGLTPRENVLLLWEEALKFCLGLINQLQFSESSKLDLIERLEEVTSMTQSSISNEVHPEADAVSSAVDQEILEAFLAEAREILENNEDALHQWQAEDYFPLSQQIPEIRRNMHTIKGGARMVGRMDIGQLSHALESLLDENHIKRFGNDPRHFETLQRAMDHIGVMLERTGAEKDTEAQSLLAALHVLLGNETPPELEESGAVIAGSETVTEVTQQTAQAAQSELGALRIEPSQLRDITNGVAESSVLTNQIAKENIQVHASIDELESTILRLRLQARRLEIETEAQMLSRNTRANEVSGDFDPLELDRFSEIQQLSRALLETVEDLSALRHSISEVLESVRLSVEKQRGLQESIVQRLTYVRAMSFTTIIPRLRKLLRQTADGSGKKVELRTEGTDIQIERTILEQLIAPLEHIIRNSVFHGIETPELRRATNKPEIGYVKIKMSRDGAELMLSISDDGAGFDLDKIRSRALTNGLIKEGQVISNNDLVKLVLLPGFTTAETISEVAGRGVGLDVLTRALKVLRARVEINNKPGVGVSFELHIPFTLAVTDTLMIRSGEGLYAIPLITMAGVGTSSQVVNSGGKRIYMYDQEEYPVYILSELFGTRASYDETLDKAIILVKSGDKRIAVEVDEIVSHQEIIVRPLNPQVADIPGISGGAVMPDGNLVFTLDLASLINNDILNVRGSNLVADTLSMGTTYDETLTKTDPLILVVDDSITMRKVSTRMLERVGYRVATARDGLDALEKLAEEKPDLIMLDIEMPRMDGFEVLAHVRNAERNANIPVIMVTSRTGEKHRQRALSLGANEYCGKPYQEAQMLALIRKFIHQ